MSTAHLDLNRTMFWKYAHLQSKLLWRKKTHYWSLQAGSRLCKIDRDGIVDIQMVKHIYRNT